jgi:hypothetical protein
VTEHKVFKQVDAAVAGQQKSFNKLSLHEKSTILAGIVLVHKDPVSELSITLAKGLAGDRNAQFAIEAYADYIRLGFFLVHRDEINNMYNEAVRLGKGPESPPSIRLHIPE